MSHFGGRGGGGGGGPDRRGRRGGGGGGNRAHPDRDDRQGGGFGGGGPQGGFGGGPRRGGGGGGGGGPYRAPQMEQRQQHPQQPPPPPQPKIDRTKICPLLLRVYIQLDEHHAASSFAVRGSEPNEDSIVCYTWPDATLRELAGLIQQVNPEARSQKREISIAFVYPDRTGTNVVKHVATIPTRAQRGRGANGQSDQKTLAELKFETGDSLSVALLQRK